MTESIELRELRVFLTLAEELHFGRTATRLHLTPSRVSQCLQELEAKLGGPLMHRTSRRVELTTLGQRFKNEVALAHEELLDVFERTRAVSRGFTGPLRLGLLQGGIEGPELFAIIRAFETRHPGCQVHVDRPPYGTAFESLRNGDIDVLVSWLPHGQSDLVCGPVLGQERRVLAVGPDHPLARRASVSIEDVADYATLSVVDELFPKEIAETKIPDKTPAGRTIRRHPSTFGDLAGHDPGRARVHINMLITSGEVVHPTTPALEKILGDGILYVPITDMPPIRRALVWPRRATDARLRGFIAVARDILRDRP